MDHGSFRDQLVFSIGFALGGSRNLLRRLTRPDDARQPGGRGRIGHREKNMAIG
jgi:hypothetical protein